MNTTITDDTEIQSRFDNLREIMMSMNAEAMEIQIGLDNKQPKFGLCFVSDKHLDEDMNPYGLTVDEEELVNLADDMASAMTDLNSQNYKSFIDARERFRAKIKSMVEHLRVNEERITKLKKTIADF
jgi:hypothetical protein